MMRIIKTLLILALLLPQLIAETATQPSGSGTTGDPYLVASLNNLYWITQNSSAWDKVFKQTANIDASATSSWDSGNGWTPIGSSIVAFTGTYDGQGHTISGLYINRSGDDEQGMFGHCYQSTLTNIGLVDVDITGHNKVGALAGNQEDSGDISDCYSTGDVTGTNDVGGLVGFNYSYSEVNTCYSTATVSGTDDIGGLVGYNYWHALVSRCYARGSATGSNGVGGLVGWNSGTSTVSNSYSTGAVSGSSNKGGLVGYNNNVVYNSFWDQTSSGESSSSYGTGKITSEMKTLSTFTDLNTDGLVAAWDFVSDPNDDENSSDFWDLDLSGSINNGYPYLSWQDGTEQSLPVVISSFTASSSERSGCIALSWSTESETENLGFVIERRETGGDWVQIASYLTHEALRGQGSVSHHTDYRFDDETVALARSYDYRLSDVSYAGEIRYHFLVILDVSPQFMPSGYLIATAYPNPFNPTVTIHYELPVAHAVAISIHEITGRHVATLVETHQAAGKYDAHWDGFDDLGNALGTGVYLCRIRAGILTKTIKLLHLK